MARVLEEALVVKGFEVHKHPVLEDILLEYVTLDEDESVVLFDDCVERDVEGALFGHRVNRADDDVVHVLVAEDLRALANGEFHDFPDELTHVVRKPEAGGKDVDPLSEQPQQPFEDDL